MTEREIEQVRKAVEDAIAERESQEIRKAVEEAMPKAVEGAMPLAIGEVLGPMIHHAIGKVLRRYVLVATVGYLILALGLLYAIHDNRVRGTRARSVLCQIITSGDRSLFAYVQEGTITQQQLNRALKQSVEYRRLLGPAPACTARVTPPPPKTRPLVPAP